METMTGKQVAYSADNLMKCQCTSCPVQEHSTCAMDKAQAMMPMMDQMRSMGMQQGTAQEMPGMGSQDAPTMQMPKPEDVPGMYCHQGTAACGDLDYAKACVCPTCAVWTENDLANQKYCQQGSAAQVG